MLIYSSFILFVLQASLQINGISSHINEDGELLSNLGIVGGLHTKIANHPYQISITYLDEHICGGSILDEFVIITAAHCLKEKLPKYLKIRTESDYREDGGEIYDVENFIVHPEFDFNHYNKDVAILWVKTAINLNSKAQAVRLISENDELPVGHAAVVTGWGRIGEEEDASNILRSVEIPVWSKKECQNAYKPGLIFDEMICAGYKIGGKDACQRDSGGPLVVKNSRNKKYPWVLIGIVSWGEGCGRAGKPGVYTNVQALRQWIDSARKMRQAL